MKLLKYKRSTSVLNLLIAIVITLTVNFSYLLSMMVEQREAGEQRTEQEQESQRKPEIDGVLHISRDGYGYVITSDSIAIQRFIKDIERRKDSLQARANQIPPARQGQTPPPRPANAPRQNAIERIADSSSPNIGYDSIYVNSRRIYLYKLNKSDAP